jgi:hypothetical protein
MHLDTVCTSKWNKSRNISVGIATDYGLDNRMIGFRIPAGGWKFFSATPRPDRLWCPRSLLYNGYKRLFHWGQRGRGVKLTTHLHLVPRSKNAWRYTSTPPIRLHYVVLSYKNHRTLPSPLHLTYFEMELICLSCSI